MTFSPLTFVPCRSGDKGEHVARLQGWLALHGYDPGKIDGDFGPHTGAALGHFQTSLEERDPGYGSPVRPELDEYTWQWLTAPLAMAMELNYGRLVHGMIRNPTFGETVAAVARQWIAQQVGGGPLRELPGNSGPVVEACTRWLAERDRLPCECGHGHQLHAPECCWVASRQPLVQQVLCECRSYVPQWRLAWCAGWVSTVLRQACESLGVDMPIKGSLSCDELAWQGRKAKLFMHAEDAKPGDLFLVRGDKAGDWTHCGVVLDVLPGPELRTAEGNTNASGSRNGDRLLERVRPTTGLDFICWRTT
jgi:hypothetical protein